MIRSFAILFVAAAPAFAQTVGVHLGSQHYPSRDFNNVNPGGYVRWDNGLTIGAYRNSFEKTSVYVGYTAEWGWLGLTGGVISGYPQPMFLAPSVRLPVGPAWARIVVLPRIEKQGSSVVHLALEWKL